MRRRIANLLIEWEGSGGVKGGSVFAFCVVVSRLPRRDGIDVDIIVVVVVVHRRRRRHHRCSDSSRRRCVWSSNFDGRALISYIMKIASTSSPDRSQLNEISNPNCHGTLVHESLWEKGFAPPHLFYDINRFYFWKQFSPVIEGSDSRKDWPLR